MADKSSTSFGDRLFTMSGWVFTVGGAIGSFVLGQANAWIGWLVALTGVLALTGQTLAVLRRCRELQEENTKQAELLREVERKLNEVPLDIVNRIRELVAPQSVTEIATRLAAHADYVLRMRRFATTAGDIHLRTFVPRNNFIFAVAKIPKAALAHLREKDVFILVRSADELRTDCALMVVHQTPDPAHGTVHFRLVELISEEARGIERLATAGGASGLMGYTLRPVCDTGWYNTLESATIPEAIKRLAEGLEREREGSR